MKIKLTPVKAIRQHCLECSGGSPSEVRNCVILDCPLYAFRLGKNPNIKSRILSREQKDEIRKRFSKTKK